jgi:hypothetical protein
MCNQPTIKTFPRKEPPAPVKKNTPAYYQCLLNESLAGFSGQKITAVCRNCKKNSPNLAEQRNQEIQVLMRAYEQMGQSLRNLLTPLAYD